MVDTDRQFWVSFRAALIQQYRAAVCTRALPEGFADAILALIGTVERHAELPGYDPAGPTAAQRRGVRD